MADTNPIETGVRNRPRIFQMLVPIHTKADMGMIIPALSLAENLR